MLSEQDGRRSRGEEWGMALLDYNIQDVSEFWCSIDWAMGPEVEITMKSSDGSLTTLKAMHSNGLVVLKVLIEGEFSELSRSFLQTGQTTSYLTIEFWRDDSGHCNAIELRLDDVPSTTLDDAELSRLRDIVSVVCQGAVTPASCGIWPISAGTTTENASLFLGNYLTLTGFIRTAGTEKPDIFLQVADHAQEIPLIASLNVSDPQANATDWSIEAPLPGWIWEGAGDRVTITMRSGRAELTRFVVNKIDILQRIETIAAEVRPEKDAGNVLSLIEHIVYGQFQSSLSSAASRFLERAAKIYGVRDFVASSQEIIPALAAQSRSSTTPPSIRAIAVTTAVELGAKLVQTAPEDMVAALDQLVKTYSLDQQQRSDFYLQLTETFIRSENFDRLIDSASRNTDILSLHLGDNWIKSVTLPYLAHGGRYREVGDILWDLNPDAGWLVTPSIAYTMRWLVDQDAPDSEAEEQVRRNLYGYMNLVRRLKSSYWGRAQCSALLQASAYLVERGNRFPVYLRDDIEAFALECHGLSAEFWRHAQGALDNAGAYIRRAAAHFSQIEAYADAAIDDRAPRKGALINALRYFYKYNQADTLRFLIELLPCDDQLHCLTGEISGLQPDRDQTLRELIRVVAHPSYAGDASEHAPELRRALAICGADVPQMAAGQAITHAVAALREFEVAQALDSDACNVMTVEVERQITSLIRIGAQAKALELAILLVSLMLKAGQAEGIIRASAKANAILNAHRPQASMPGIQAALRGLGNADPKWRPLVGDLLQYADASPEVLQVTTHADASQIFDTIVTIISCQKYIDERGPAIIDGWVQKLQALGIPYVFIIGGEETKLCDDVLQLDCPDDYEHLPEKVLATIRWVQENTNFGFMLKIDDDCFLNVDEFFLEHSYRNHDYYGRSIYRQIGGMDRMWHMQKSTSHRARKELDKSPEPSLYADGGSGYTLSRTAMNKILDQVETSFGAMLKNSSYMEDKLIGDLLQLSGISIASEGYNIAVFRKLPQSSTSVGMFANSFLPSRVWPVKLAHLDRPELFPKAAAQSEAFSLRPSKIWPSYASPLTGANTNALELVSDHAGVPGLLRQDHAVISCVRNERHIMPAFLDHYRKLGVKSFLISDNCSTDGTLTYLLEQPDVVCFACDTEYKNSTFGVAWQQSLLAGFRSGLWSIVIDADEFLVFPGYKDRPITEFLDEQGTKGYDAITSFMLDMYPKGPLSEFDVSRDDPFKVATYVDSEPLRSVWFHGPYSNSPTWTSSLRHRLAPNAGVSSFTSQKTCILKYKPWMQLSAGLHYVGDAKIAGTPAVLCHFKYHVGFHKKVMDEIGRNQHFDDSAEYRAYAEALEGGFNGFFSKEGSVRWDQAEIIKRTLAGDFDLPCRI